jgi:hypothetical protein
VKHATRSVSRAEAESAASDGAYTPKSSPMRPTFQSEHPDSIYSPYAESGNPVPKECVV